MVLVPPLSFDLACLWKGGPTVGICALPADAAKGRGVWVHHDWPHRISRRTGPAVIASECAGVGTVDHTPVYPREVVTRALAHGASAIVLVHNHPSGDPTPSRADVTVTRQIVDAMATVGIAVHDHIIIAGERHLSLRGEGLM